MLCAFSSFDRSSNFALTLTSGRESRKCIERMVNTKKCIELPKKRSMKWEHIDSYHNHGAQTGERGKTTKQQYH